MAEQQATATSPSQPGISAEVLQRLVDQAAHFNVLSIPDRENPGAAIYDSGSKNITGIRINETLHRFYVNVLQPTSHKPLTARNAVGEATGSFTQLWMLIPAGFH